MFPEEEESEAKNTGARKKEIQASPGHFKSVELWEHDAKEDNDFPLIRRSRSSISKRNQGDEVFESTIPEMALEPTTEEAEPKQP